MHTGLARQKRDGSWWFCTRMAKQYKYHWPIGNASSADIKPGQLVQVIKRPCQAFCFIPVQLDIFKHHP
jgi:hypothetical protein